MSYRIKCTPCYSAGTCNAPQAHYITDKSNDICEWDTETEAQEWIDEQDNETYYLSHGEIGRPAYEIINTESTDEEPDCIEYDDSDSHWQLVDPDDLPDDVQDKLDSLNVVHDHAAGDSHDIYSAVLSNYGETDEDYGTDYRITFCVQTTAIQVNINDLSGVNWDHPSYYKAI